MYEAYLMKDHTQSLPNNASYNISPILYIAKQRYDNTHASDVSSLPLHLDIQSAACAGMTVQTIGMIARIGRVIKSGIY